MPASIPGVAALLLLVFGGSAATAQLPTSRSEALGATRVIELSVNAPKDAFELRIGTGLLTVLEFGTPLKLAGVEVENRELFSRVAMLEDLIILTPSSALAAGSRSRLKVRFVEGSVPASADFLLVVDPARVDRQVRVMLLPLLPELSWQQVQAERAETQRCQMELTRALQQPEGLTGLIVRDQLDERGVVVAEQFYAVDLPHLDSGTLLRVKDGRTYRAKGVVAVELWVSNVSARPWTAAGAELVGEGGVRLQVLRVWPAEALTADSVKQRLIIEANVTEQEARGRFKLLLWQKDEPPSVSVDGVVFPSWPQTRAGTSR